MRGKASEKRKQENHGECRGGEPSRLYKIWSDAKIRCRCSRNKRFHRYGGRGIKFCSEWDSFLTFKEWALANGYNEELIIDRINNDGDYCPNNCRWVTQKQSAANRSTTKLDLLIARNIRACREALKLSERKLAKKFNAHYSSVHAILHDKIWQE